MSCLTKLTVERQCWGTSSNEVVYRQVN